MTQPLSPDEDKYFEKLLPDTFPEHLTVPLTVYIRGERKVIGEANIQGDKVIAEIGPDAGAMLMGHILENPNASSFRFSAMVPKQGVPYQTSLPLDLFSEMLKKKIREELIAMNNTTKKKEDDGS